MPLPLVVVGAIKVLAPVFAERGASFFFTPRVADPNRPRNAHFNRNTRVVNDEIDNPDPAQIEYLQSANINLNQPKKKVWR